MTKQIKIVKTIFQIAFFLLFSLFIFSFRVSALSCINNNPRCCTHLIYKTNPNEPPNCSLNCLPEQTGCVPCSQYPECDQWVDTFCIRNSAGECIITCQEVSGPTYQRDGSCSTYNPPPSTSPAPSSSTPVNHPSGCGYCAGADQCYESGGTTMSVPTTDCAGGSWCSLPDSACGGSYTPGCSYSNVTPPNCAAEGQHVASRRGWCINQSSCYYPGCECNWDSACPGGSCYIPPEKTCCQGLEWRDSICQCPLPPSPVPSTVRGCFFSQT